MGTLHSCTLGFDTVATSRLGCPSTSRAAAMEMKCSTPQLSRTGVRFLNNNLVWYQGERPCTDADHCGLGGANVLTDQTFIYDIGGAAESPSRLTSVLDAWPHVG